MNQQETIVLWRRCEDARALTLAAGKSEDEAHKIATAIWNEWATDLLVRKAELDKAGVWAVGKEVARTSVANLYADRARMYGGFKPKNELTRRWIEDAATDFSSLRFAKEASMKEALDGLERVDSLLPRQKVQDVSYAMRNVEFEPTISKAINRFEGWIFPGDALFDEVEFSGAAWFSAAQFYGTARFDGARFFGAAWFDNASFSNEHIPAQFRQVQFEAHANFESAVFRAGADFTAINSGATFNMAGATFNALPSFIQANFKEAPRLDNITLARNVEPGGFWRSLFVESSKDVTSKYRALKRLAIQGHDHEREYLFFKGELRSRRTSEDRWWYSRCWIGILYDLVSDFGRSVWRPFFIWLLWAAVLAKLYAVSAARPAPASCSQPFWEGLYLAVRNGFPLNGAKDQRIADGYSCLYSWPSGSSGTVHNNPVWIGYAELVHALGSVVLIFLIALALRNHFRIK